MISVLVNYPADFPSIVLPTVSSRNQNIIGAVLVSLLVHGIGLGWLPGLKGQMTQVSQTLQILLPAPQVQLEPDVAPSTPTTAPAPKTIRREGDFSKRDIPPLLTNSASQTRDDAPPVKFSVPVVSPADESAPLSHSPSTSLPKRIAPEVLAGYGRELAGAVAMHQRYPRIALMRQWQGTVVLQLEFEGEGRLSAVRVLSSSGYEILDQQALEMVRETAPHLPVALAGRPLTIDVPIVFRITS
jgi:protein TonB